jgi:microsomal dipeptidase-like Zn-dependent dipeptidase
MSRVAMEATLDLLDAIDPGKQVPVLASHGACDGVAKAEYNLRDKHIRRIAERRGVIGLIACEHWMAQGMHAPKTIPDSVALLIRHIERIEEVAKDIPGRLPYESIGIGSDQDGFIKPALEGLKTPLGYAHVITGLQDHFHDDAIVTRICEGNALDVLKRGWKGAPGAPNP